MKQDKPGWKSIAWGGLILDARAGGAGCSDQYVTGGWRSARPIRDDDKCNQCLRCWVFCPDGSVLLKDGKVYDFDLEHCKGCGICAKECPDKASAITMKNESEFRE